MLTITGLVAGHPYDVTVGGGKITGSTRVADLLEEHEGRPFTPHPTEGALLLDLTDDRSVLTALRSLTTVTGVIGEQESEDDPDEVDPAGVGITVY